MQGMARRAPADAAVASAAASARIYNDGRAAGGCQSAQVTTALQRGVTRQRRWHGSGAFTHLTTARLQGKARKRNVHPAGRLGAWRRCGARPVRQGHQSVAHAGRSAAHYGQQRRPRCRSARQNRPGARPYARGRHIDGASAQQAPRASASARAGTRHGRTRVCLARVAPRKQRVQLHAHAVVP